MTTNLGNVPTTGVGTSLATHPPTKEKGQRSISDAYFARLVPVWSQPSALTPQQWRVWVASQPIASDCKETMISNLTALDWKITPRESDQRDELRGTINYYEKFFRNGGYSGLDWAGFLEWFLADLLDLPFGTGWEVGRKGDSPQGRAAWLEPLDGGTLYPTLNKDFPVMQYYLTEPVYFPAHAIARAYLSPRTEIERKGWGIAPPEKAFLAMEMLARGDRYYANLLLDVPPVGVFDLGDVEWEDANTWIQSFRTFTQGGSADGFKIPVLAGHTGEAKFIPLGKPPADIMYDRITLKYAALLTAAYGMTLSDIGLQATSASGETLAGTIRGEQKTNRTGKARVKSKIKYFIETILPPNLQFDYIDTDGERLSMLGRARLANATAFNQFHQMGAISPEEARLQGIQDGLFTISMPEKPPKEAQPQPKLNPFNKAPERPGSVGSPQPPSLGGDGEVRQSRSDASQSVTFKSLPSAINKSVRDIVSILAPSVSETLLSVPEDEIEPMKSMISESIFSEEADSLGNVFGNLVKPFGEFRFDGLESELESLLVEEGLYPVNIESHIHTLKQKVEQDFPAFIGRAIVYTLTDSQFLLDGDFEGLVGDVQERINKSLADYVSAFVGIEVQNLLEQVRAGEQEVPEFVRLRAVSRKSPMVSNVTVESPQISLPSISVEVPERSLTVSPMVNVEQPEINIPEQPAPIVNLSVSNPEQPAPIVNLNVPERSVTVEPSIVNLTVPEQTQLAPIVNVTNEINPTPVQVNIPPPKDKKITIVKDGNVWTGEADSKE